MSTPLPQELIDLIVDELQDDHAALKCMSLTHRAFRLRTRFHLFRRVELFEDKQAQKFSALCRDSPDIVPLVVSLETAYCYFNDEDSRIPFPFLPSLRQIMVSSAQDFDFQVPLALSSSKKSYVSAVFWQLEVDGLSEILEIIGGSSELQHLTLMHLTSETEPLTCAEYEDYLLEGRPLCPESFAIEYTFPKLYDLLLPQTIISFERLRDFAVSVFFASGVRFAVAVISLSLKTLQNLRIQFSSDMRFPIWPEEFTLSHIRSIDIIAFDPDQAQQGCSSDLHCWMIDCLTRKINRLEKATIRIATPDLSADPPTFSDWDWVLTGESMPSLRFLTIQVVHCHDVLDPTLAGIFRSKVENQFPILQSRGWLDVEFTYNDRDEVNMLKTFALAPY
ncbi:hypothetical protein IW261DRAFT_796357 [Armillaria novae-zelandiae]|uniref:Uncharacterized protein n=1 Tax=Armillaria novae-zelandiae TaxID=153914 RepID=A0AA39UGJ2_9AGAR|nr:hypothetical protein IW261DRAFT_796357 [Armillaria novae-zelandiae]